MFTSERTPRPHYAKIFDELAAMAMGQFEERRQLADLSFLLQGITFTVYSDGRGTERLFPFDLVPRILPRSEWDQHTIAEVMRRDVDAVTIPQTADALTALAKMQGTGSSRLLVVDGDRIAGILTLKDLLHFLQVKMELQNSGNDDRQDHGSVEQHEHYVHT